MLVKVVYIISQMVLVFNITSSCASSHTEHVPVRYMYIDIDNNT